MAKLLTVEDLADQLAIKPKTIYNLRSTGDTSRLPPAVTIGGKLRWRQQDIDDWLVAQLPTSNVTAITTRRAIA